MNGWAGDGYKDEYEYEYDDRTRGLDTLKSWKERELYEHPSLIFSGRGLCFYGHGWWENLSKLSMAFFFFLYFLHLILFAKRISLSFVFLSYCGMFCRHFRNEAAMAKNKYA